MTPEATALITAASPLLLGVCTWFVRGMAADMKATAALTTTHTTLLAVYDTRLRRAEEDLAALRIKNDDLVGFLQSQGFKKREG